MSADRPAATANPRRQMIIFGLMVVALLTLPWLGKGALLFALVLGLMLVGVPLFALIAMVTVACFLLFTDGVDEVSDFTNLVERIRTLADSENLLAVPLFMLSGAVMARGQISTRLVEFSKALIGFAPGGLAASGVLACMLFAAISGSSPATVVAIGSMMAPSLIANGYPERFSHGLLTSSGSLGILIPPSIPMILYPLVFPQNVEGLNEPIETAALFASGVGPGALMGMILMGFCIYQGVLVRASRTPFSFARLSEAFTKGFWSLLFPLIVLGGIYTGFMTVVEASAISVVYAVAVELFVHRAITPRQLPKVFSETGVILGSLLVIMVASLAFSEFLMLTGVPERAAQWVADQHWPPWAFLLALNIGLLIVGTMMDILSAMFIFVPLLAPIAVRLGVDPMHFGIIFIVNLEIGYLTPPVGLNLFVASTLYKKPVGHLVRSVLPFIALMLVALALITYVPQVSVGLGEVILGGDDQTTSAPPRPIPMERDSEGLGEPNEDSSGGVQSLQEMMQEALGEDDEGSEPGSGLTPEEQQNPGRVMTMEEMMQAAESGNEGESGESPEGDDEGTDEGSDPGSGLTPEEQQNPGRVMTMEEMMQAAED